MSKSILIKYTCDHVLDCLWPRNQKHLLKMTLLPEKELQVYKFLQTTLSNVLCSKRLALFLMNIRTLVNKQWRESVGYCHSICTFHIIWKQNSYAPTHVPPIHSHVPEWEILRNIDEILFHTIIQLCVTHTIPSMKIVLAPEQICWAWRYFIPVLVNSRYLIYKNN